MAATPSPAFAINGGTVGAKASVSSGGSITATLNDTAGVSPVTWWVANTDDTTSASDYTLVQSGAVGQTVSFTAKGPGTAGELRAKVAGGIDPSTGDASEAMEASVKWYVPTEEGLEVLVAGELEDDNRLGSSTHGAIVALNSIIRNGGRLGDWKASVRVATTAALAANTRTGNVLTADANGALAAIDGVSLSVDQRLLVKNEATGANNGVYTVTSLGSAGSKWSLTRATDFDASAEVTAMCLVPVEEGTTNADQVFVLTTNNTITLNTTALTFTNLGSLMPLVTAAARGTVNALGAANTVLTTDGSTAGGSWAQITNSHVAAGAAILPSKIAPGSNDTVLVTVAGAAGWSTITNQFVDNAAAIAGTKISPNFGAQPVITTSTVTCGGLSFSAGGITWQLGVATPTISQSAKTSDALPESMVVTPQAPFATATGANRKAGSFLINLAAPTNSGTSEAALVVQRASTTHVEIGPYETDGTAYSAIWMGPGITKSATNFAFLSNGSTRTYLNGLATNSQIFLSFAGNIVNGLNICGSTHATPNRLQWAEGMATPAFSQEPRTTDAAAQILKVAAQNALASAATNVDGGPLHLQGGSPKTAGTTGLRGPVRLQVGADATTGTLVEACEPVVGQRVVALAQRGAGISSTQMPANTGDGVVFVANAGTNPSANPVGGGILYSNAGAGTWRGSGGTVTAFGPAGLHCSKCGYDAWRVAAINTEWKSWHFECGHCNANYRGGPKDVLALLTSEQRAELITDAMGWDEVARLMKVDPPSPTASPPS